VPVARNRQFPEAYGGQAGADPVSVARNRQFADAYGGQRAPIRDNVQISDRW